MTTAAKVMLLPASPMPKPIFSTMLMLPFCMLVSPMPVSPMPMSVSAAAERVKETRAAGRKPSPEHKEKRN
ncbi:hypothetical protein GCM10010082_14890 [Kushneria pakistanensis]|uniref:Secreted protein n=1 Tax=Kushneria pakistanensis TaxID=1508770 RepID=A0ABQ3FGV3_9GAMM|nr:hypothetical protein GCM10010082_14890 [Kushneria pakistanensis]